MTKSENARNIVNEFINTTKQQIPILSLEKLISDSTRLENIERHFRALLENADALNILFERVGEVDDD